jgi:hypothetical protein
MDLVTFLRARLDEDSAEIDRHPVDGSALDPYAEPAGFQAETETQYPCYPLLRIGKGRALAEVAAKRQILSIHSARYGTCLGCGFDNQEEPMSTIDQCPTLRALAAAWSDHPDYDAAWSPDQ